MAGEVVARLKPEQFNSLASRGLFEAISKLHFAGAPIDPVTVQREAGADYEAAITDVRQWYTARSNLPYYCDLLRDYGRLRKVQLKAASISAAASFDEVRESIDRINGLMVDRDGVQIVSLSQLVLDFYKRQETDAKPEYLRFGLPELDEMLYTELGDFIVVGGYASAGKTMLSIQFALELANKYRVGYFSLETGAAKFADRCIAHQGQVSLKKIKERKLDETDWAGVEKAGTKSATQTLDFIDAARMSVRDIQAVSLNKRYQVIVVDYLQILESRTKERLYEQITEISKELHTLARANGIAVIALSQLSRAEKEKGKPKPPTMASLRESGQIEQDADVVMLLYPEDPNNNRSRRILKIAKNKEGERGKIELDFDGATQTLSPSKPTAGEQYRALQKAIRDAGRQPKEQVSFTELTGADPNLPF
jgi:replicative DNA helicase